MSKRGSTEGKPKKYVSSIVQKEDEFLSTHPGVTELLLQVDGPVHPGNPDRDLVGRS